MVEKLVSYFIEKLTGKKAGSAVPASQLWTMQWPSTVATSRPAFRHGDCRRDGNANSTEFQAFKAEAVRALCAPKAAEKYSAKILINLVSTPRSLVPKGWRG